MSPPMISVCSFQKHPVTFLIPGFAYICLDFCSCSWKLSAMGVRGIRGSSAREGDPILKAPFPTNVSILGNEMSLQIGRSDLSAGWEGFPPQESSSDPCHEPAPSCPSLCPLYSPLHCATASPKQMPSAQTSLNLVVWDLWKEGI